MKTLSTFLCILITTIGAYAQYNDVAIIVNDSSQVSLDVGNYFLQQRNIPVQNVIHITTPVAEEIDSLTFENIRTQIESQLLAGGLHLSINYLVTTKGVPLKVQTSSCNFITGGPTDISCSSFDSELSLLLSPFSANILQKQGVPCPYYKQSKPFSRDSTGIFLVTRLDGYNKTDIFDLIDRSGQNIFVDSPITKSIFDISSFTTSAALPILESDLKQAMIPVWSRNLDTVYHPDTTILTNQTNVLLYHRAHFNSHTVPLQNTYVRGALATMLASGGGGTFSDSTTGKMLVADLIREGITSGHSYVYSTFLGHPNHIEEEILFDSYLQGYNLAESFYRSINLLSWQDVIIGDPKTSIVFSAPAKLEDLQSKEKLSLFPNPTKGMLRIVSQTNVQTIEVYNVQGKLVQQATAETGQSIREIRLKGLPQGIYTLKLISNDQAIFRKVSLTK